MKKKSHKIVSLIALLISAYFANNYVQENNNPVSYRKETQAKFTSNKQLESLIKKRQSNTIITLEAMVINILSDDNQGDKHQRLIVKSGKNTLLLAHNIDIAPRVPVKKGDRIKVRGEYEWNAKGGVIHWTHRSTNSHANGWIIHNKKKYQ